MRQGAPPPQQRQEGTAPRDQTRDFACLVAAKKLIAKMSACELNMEGISEEHLCKRQDVDVSKMQYMAGRSCPEVHGIMFGPNR